MTAILKPERVETLPARQGRFDPDEFFQTGQGLYVWKDFRNEVVASASNIESVPELSVPVFTLTQDATDEQIRSELPEGHVFEDTSIFCYHLAGMIEVQNGGEEGVLLNNCCANIFYVQVADQVFAVRVVWIHGDRRWDVGADCCVGRDWYAGGRVFPAVAVA